MTFFRFVVIYKLTDIDLKVQSVCCRNSTVGIYTESRTAAAGRHEVARGNQRNAPQAPPITSKQDYANVGYEGPYQQLDNNGSQHHYDTLMS